MAGPTKIEWATDVWNPIRGCSRVSEGCRHCYAERVAARFAGPGQPYQGLARRWGGEPRWTGSVRFVEAQIDVPLRWRRPRRIFVNSMSDLFHDRVEYSWIDRIFAVMALAPQHVFVVLTKRPERMRAWAAETETPARVWAAAGEVADRNERLLLHGLAAQGAAWGGATPWPLRNVWLGVSVENQPAFDQRWPRLRDTPAAKRLISFEPLLGPVAGDMAGLDWAIVGGESGPNARPMHPDWARSLRDQCASAGVAFHFKQHGEFREWSPDTPTEEVDNDSETADAIVASAVNPSWIDLAGHHYRRRVDLPPGVPCRLLERLGKARSGRLLDGREWNEVPA